VIFVRAPGSDSPTEVWHWLLTRGCRPLHSRVFFDGYEWRGSGRVEQGAGDAQARSGVGAS
jgi:hypothetical protein